MYAGRYAFAQLVRHLPMGSFHRAVRLYKGNHKVKSFSCRDQFLVMMFAQLTFRESLRDIEINLRAQRAKLNHLGLRSVVSRNTLANANSVRDWRIYEAFAHALIRQARTLYRDEPFGITLDRTVFALDATTIDLSMGLFPWASFRTAKSAVKIHTLLDLRGNIPSFIDITDGKHTDNRVLDAIPIEPGALYIMDRAYTDFLRLHRLHRAGAFFILRAKRNLQFRRVESRTVDRAYGLRCDQTIDLVIAKSAELYPDRLRRVKLYDAEKKESFVFITNNFQLPAATIAELYRLRWQVELFFKWIKQHLRIKAFFGTSVNAVKTQIWIGVCTYVLIAIVKKRLRLEASMHSILQVLSLNLFERIPLEKLLTGLTLEPDEEMSHDNTQLLLFT